MSPQTDVCGLIRQFKTYAWICLFVALTFMSCGARAGGGFAFTLPTGTVNQPYSFNLSTMPNAFVNTQFTTQGGTNFGYGGGVCAFRGAIGCVENLLQRVARDVFHHQVREIIQVA